MKPNSNANNIKMEFDNNIREGSPNDTLGIDLDEFDNRDGCNVDNFKESQDLKIDSQEFDDELTSTTGNDSIFNQGYSSPYQLASPLNNKEEILESDQQPIVVNETFYDPVSNARNFNSTLINEIRPRLCLYDHTNDQYKSNDQRFKHWTEISENLNQPMEFVRTRWKTLRDRFKKEFRRIQMRLPIIWPHFEEMNFLIPFIKDRPIGDEGQNTGSTSQKSFENDLSKSNNFYSNKTKANGKFNSEVNQEEGDYSNGSCTAAILDLAMSAVNKLSPKNYSIPRSPQDSNSSADGTNLTSHTESHLVSNSRAVTASSSSHSVTVTTNLLKPFYLETNLPKQQSQSSHNQQQYLQRHPPQNYSIKRPRISMEIERQEDGKMNGHGCTSYVENEDDEDEDQLFCRIMMMKLKKMDEQKKERAKAKIMETLVELQYGNGNKNGV